MKKNVMVIAAMMISTIIFAQGNRNGAFGARPPRSGPNNDLGISEAQRTSIEGINKKYTAKQADALKALREQKDKEITAVLTPEQKAKREQLKREAGDKRMQFEEKAVAAHDARMKSTLLLSDEQATKLHAEDVAYRTKMSAVRKDQPSPGSDRDQFKKMSSEHESAVQSILNNEQFKKWSSLNAPGRNQGPHAGRGQFDGQRAFNQPRFRDGNRNQQPHKGQRGTQRNRGDRRGPNMNDHWSAPGRG